MSCGPGSTWDVGSRPAAPPGPWRTRAGSPVAHGPPGHVGAPGLPRRPAVPRPSCRVPGPPCRAIHARPPFRLLLTLHGP
eukprot:10687370-Alexandrium_andersonii.AAC.1